MSENINALDEIHKGACMGCDAISFVLDKVEDNDFKNELESEFNFYKSIETKIDKIYSKYDDGEPHETGIDRQYARKTLRIAVPFPEMPTEKERESVKGSLFIIIFRFPDRIPAENLS